MNNEEHNSKEIWQAAKQHLSRHMAADQLATWIEPLALAQEGGGAVITVPNLFYIDWVAKNYLGLIREALQQAGLAVEHVELRVDEALMPGRPAVRPSTYDWTAAAAPAANGGFAGFVAGACNRLAYETARNVADEPGGQYNPLVIFGGSGLGKTHLLSAMAGELSRRHPHLSVVFCTSEEFTSGYAQAVRFGGVDEFRRANQGLDCLILDDLHFLAGREGTQRELLYTIDQLEARGGQVVVSIDRAPRDLSEFNRQLVSRLESGLLADLRAPSPQTCMEILQRKADERGVVLAEGVANYLAGRPDGNIRLLEGCLNRIAAVSRFQGVEVTLELAKRVVRPLFGEQHVRIGDVLEAVCGAFGVSLAELKGSSKTREISHPRQVAMYMCRKMTGASYPEIGKALGGKDHSTVVKAVKKLERQITRDAALADTVASLERRLLDGEQLDVPWRV